MPFNIKDFEWKAQEIFENKVVPQIKKAMMKQTAVEWFNQQLVDRQNGKGDSRSWDEILEQAKAMEKEQLLTPIDDAITEFERLRDESETLRDRVYLDGVLAVLDGIKSNLYEMGV